MGKIFLVLALVVIASILIPQVRERTLPLAEPVLEPAARVLGPHLRKLRNPIYRKNAESEIEIIRRRLGQLHPGGANLPDRREFRRFMRTQMQLGRNGNDPWGSPYYLLSSRQLVIIGSSGPDGVQGNEDDVRLEVPREEF